MKNYKKLPHGAYGNGVSGAEYVPLLEKNDRKGEFSVAVVVIGIILAIVFGGSNAYLGIMAGMTVAAGIPGAILGGGLLNMLGKKSLAGTTSIQAMAAGGESVASGIIFVIPALLIMGGKVDPLPGILVGIIGVLLGVGFTAFIRKYLVVQSHGELLYPESMAVSETVITANMGGFGLKVMAIGAFIGSLFTLLNETFVGLFQAGFTINEKVTTNITSNTKYQIGGEVNPALIGVGFIVGKRIGLIMMAGAIFANLVLIPLIGMFSGFADPSAILFPSTVPLVAMGSSDIFKNMIKYIGAGAIATGGIISVIKLIPVIINSVKDVLFSKKSSTTENDDADISPIYALLAIIGTFIIGFVLAVFLGVSPMYAVVGAIIAAIMSLLFTVVAARLTGEVGTSNLPVSGMTIATLLVLATVLSFMMHSAGIEDKTIQILIILFLAIIVTAISTAGGFAQSVKVSFIIGTNTKNLEKLFTIGSIIGVFTVIPIILLLQEQIISGTAAAPQANLMAVLTTGIVSGQLPWLFIFVGAAIAIALYFLEVPVMSFAIGMYLPMAVSMCVLIGGIIRYFVEKTNKNDEVESEKRVGKGITFASGLIAGGAITGLLLAAFNLFVLNSESKPLTPFITAPENLITNVILSISALVIMCGIIYFVIISGESSDETK